MNPPEADKRRWTRMGNGGRGPPPPAPAGCAGHALGAARPGGGGAITRAGGKVLPQGLVFSSQ